MQFYISILLLFLVRTSAYTLRQRKTGECPAIWSDIATELQSSFEGCGRDAHKAIRVPFHDCINNGCDGSLLVADECGRSENAGLEDICIKLMDWTVKYNVSAADMIQFAAATAIAVCPLGPRVRALVGRKDSWEAATEGQVPGSKDSAQSILAAFSAKGFSADDLVALMGTHSIGIQDNDDLSQAGKSLDSTPGTCDMKFYSETKDGTAPYSLQSDKLLSNDEQTGGIWDEFANDQTAWATAFTDAWNRFAVIGNEIESLQDCSSLIPIASLERRRAMSAPSAA